MDVSVIIVNYNTLQMTKDCIDSVIEKTTDVEYEIILVDNASTDGSREFFKNYRGITYIYNEKNLGFGAANNTGAKTSTGDFLFFLNSDTLFKNNALLIFYRSYASNTLNNIGFLGCALVDAHGEINGSGCKFPSIIRELLTICRLNIFLKKRIGQTKKPYPIDYVLGADMFVSRHLFEKLHGFDEQFFMYYEESDLQKRSVSIGYLNYIIDGPIIIHLEGKSSNGLTLNKRLMINNSKFKYFKKHNDSLSYFVFRFIYALLGLRVLISKRLSIREKNVYVKSLLK